MMISKAQRALYYLDYSADLLLPTTSNRLANPQITANNFRDGTSSPVTLSKGVEYLIEP